jgi:hypothetical protein
VRKLVVLGVIILAVIAIVAVSCLIYPPLQSFLYDGAVNVAGPYLVGGITSGLTGLLSWGTTGLTTATIVILGIGIAFTIFWLAVKKYLWDKHLAGKTPTFLTIGPKGTIVAREEPRDVIMSESPAPTKTKSVAKEEAKESESTSPNA